MGVNLCALASVGQCVYTWVSVCTRASVCVYTRVSVCTRGSVCVHVRQCVYTWVSVCTRGCEFVCTSLRGSVCAHVRSNDLSTLLEPRTCMHACMHACLRAYVLVCFPVDRLYHEHMHDCTQNQHLYTHNPLTVAKTTSHTNSDTCIHMHTGIHKHLSTDTRARAFTHASAQMRTTKSTDTARPRAHTRKQPAAPPTLTLLGRPLKLTGSLTLTLGRPLNLTGSLTLTLGRPP